MTAADEVVVLDFADEKSVVQTRFATTALTLFRAHLGLHTDDAVRDAETALAEPLPEGLLDCTQFSFLGRGWTVGLANEAALKMKEASLSWTESYPAMEYRHGPISIATTGTATWMFGSAPEGLAEQVLATGARWIESGLDPLAELVRVQRLAIARAVAAWPRPRPSPPPDPVGGPRRGRRGLTGTPTDRAAGGCSTRRTVRRTAEGRGQASSK